MIVLAAIETVAGIAGPIAQHQSLAAQVSSYGLTNLAIGISFVVPGAILVHYRQRNPIGWIVLAGGLAYLTTAALNPLVSLGSEHGWPVPLVRGIGTMVVLGWPWAIGLALPLTLMLFPTGSLPSPRWRPVFGCTIGIGLLFVASQALDPAPEVVDGKVLHTYVGLPFLRRLDPLWLAANILPTTVLVPAITSLFLRYRHGDEARRRQLLWLAYAAIVAIVLNLQRFTVGNGPVVLLLAIPLIPIAIAIAIARYQLLDIRLVFARTVAYLLLTAGVVAVFAAGVALLDRLLTGYGAPLLVTLVIALAFNPVRVRLQRTVDGLLYGSRSDPVRTVSRVNTRLAADDLPACSTASGRRCGCRSSRCGDDGREVAASGTPAETLHVQRSFFEAAPRG